MKSICENCINIADVTSQIAGYQREFAGAALFPTCFSHRIAQHVIDGEVAKCDMNFVREWRQNLLPPLLIGYDPDDIYKMDETALFFKCLPNKTLGFIGEKCHGGKFNKERVTVATMCNMTGHHKLPLVVIGRSRSPRCFGRNSTLPVKYMYNGKVWMTTDFFSRMLVEWEKDFSAEGRNILLFVDNCPSHVVLPETVLQSIRIEYLPPNYTSHLQRLDSGIIKNVKHLYQMAILAEPIRYMEEKNELNRLICCMLSRQLHLFGPIL